MFGLLQFLQPGKGSWENQISSVSSVSEVGPDQSPTESLRPFVEMARKSEDYQRKEKFVFSS